MEFETSEHRAVPALLHFRGATAETLPPFSLLTLFTGRMQSKISAFFKPTSVESIDPPSPQPNQLDAEDEDVGFLGRKGLDIRVTYSRQTSKPANTEREVSEIHLIGDTGVSNHASVGFLTRSGSSSSVFNKKRSYAQYYLELGQSDFLLHTCSICGLQYARGEEGDEKVHKVFHKNYSEGIQFKGWHNERVVPMPWTDRERVVLVVDSDPPVQKHKVREVVKVMERDLCLSEEWFIHKFCKVYLFISRNRIAGCLVAEPIKVAHRVIPNSGSIRISDDNNKIESTAPITEPTRSKLKTLAQSVLRFGNINFHRETSKRRSSKAGEVSLQDSGALSCEEKFVAAVCGVRAVWVAPSLRRRRIASRLLDALRMSFITNSVLEPSQCAFSQPTSAGRAFATSYSGTQTFLVYKAAD